MADTCSRKRKRARSRLCKLCRNKCVFVQGYCKRCLPEPSKQAYMCVDCGNTWRHKGDYCRKCGKIHQEQAEEGDEDTSSAPPLKKAKTSSTGTQANFLSMQKLVWEREKRHMKKKWQEEKARMQRESEEEKQRMHIGSEEEIARVHQILAAQEARMKTVSEQSEELRLCKQKIEQLDRAKETIRFYKSQMRASVVIRQAFNGRTAEQKKKLAVREAKVKEDEEAVKVARETLTAAEDATEVYAQDLHNWNEELNDWASELHARKEKLEIDEMYVSSFRQDMHMQSQKNGLKALLLPASCVDGVQHEGCQEILQWVSMSMPKPMCT